MFPADEMRIDSGIAHLFYSIIPIFVFWMVLPYWFISLEKTFFYNQKSKKEEKNIFSYNILLLDFFS